MLCYALITVDGKMRWIPQLGLTNKYLQAVKHVTVINSIQLGDVNKLYVKSQITFRSKSSEASKVIYVQKVRKVT